jgi:hypothetical protein|nr:DUF3568 family protein [Acidithiobacillus ferruginosus]
MEDKKVSQISSRRAYAYLALGCAVLVAPLSGCVALLGAGAGAGGATYVAGGGLSDYQAYYPVSLGQATAASRAVLGEMHISYTGNLHKKENEEAIYGKTTDGTKVSVNLQSPSAKVTKVEMGVGLMGNKVLSQQFFRLLSQRLGVHATVTPPVFHN